MEEFAQTSGEDGIVMFSLRSMIKNLTGENRNMLSGLYPDAVESQVNFKLFFMSIHCFLQKEVIFQNACVARSSYARFSLFVHICLNSANLA